MGINIVFMAWIKRPSLAHSTAINQHRVCVVSSLIQSLVSGGLYVECHKHQSYFSVYYFSHLPQIMLQEIDGNWINCCVYFEPELVAGRTDLLDDWFDFFSHAHAPGAVLSKQKQSNLHRAGRAGCCLEGTWQCSSLRVTKGITDGLSGWESLWDLSFCVFHVIMPFWCALCHLTLTHLIPLSYKWRDKLSPSDEGLAVCGHLWSSVFLRWYLQNCCRWVFWTLYLWAWTEVIQGHTIQQGHFTDDVIWQNLGIMHVPCHHSLCLQTIVKKGVSEKPQLLGIIGYCIVYFPCCCGNNNLRKKDLFCPTVPGYSTSWQGYYGSRQWVTWHL